MKTQKQLIALLKQPLSFLTEFAKIGASVAAARWNEENPDHLLTADGLLEDYDVESGNAGSLLRYLDCECNGLEINGVQLLEVYSKGGGEGGGESVVRVWAVKVDGEVVKHLRATGFYQSYNGTEFNDEIEIVDPHDMIVTRYLTKAERKRDKTSRFT